MIKTEIKQEAELFRDKFNKKEAITIIFLSDDFLVLRYIWLAIGDFFEFADPEEMKKIEGVVRKEKWDDFLESEKKIHVRFLCRPDRDFREWFATRLYQRVAIA